jgi:DNA-binding SARP family transcriptional activator
MNGVVLRIMGKCEIEAGNRVIRPDSPQLFFLLLLLSAEPGSSFSRATLADMLFPRSDDPHAAAHNLRQLIYRLRGLRVPIETNGQTVTIDEKSITDSTISFLAANPIARLAMLARDNSLLPNYTAPSDSASDWLERYRDLQHSALRRQLASDLSHFRDHADWKAVERVANALLALDPLHESATLALAESVARTGSKALAISLLERYERDLGVSSPSLSLPPRLLRSRLVERSLPERNRQSSPSLLGRAKEMERLAHLWRECRRGRFHILHIHGPKAVGKSRLIDEFRTLVNHDGSGVVVRTQALQRDADRPLSLFSRLLPDLLALPGAAGCNPESLPLFRRLTDAGAPDGPIGTPFASSTFDEAALRNALADLVASVSEEQPLLCLVDDAHALDSASLSMLNAILCKHPLAPVLFVLTSRLTTLSLGDLSTAIFSDLRLPPLAQTDATALVASICQCAGRQLDAADTNWIVSVACGNPGHLELLIESSSMREPRTIPTDIIDLVDERITALTFEARQVLCSVAVAAEGADADDIASLTGLDSWSILSSLDALDDASLLERGERGLVCRSSVIADRSIHGSSKLVVSLMHERLARRLELTFHSNSGMAGLAWRIAAHWKAAGQSTRARRCLRACWQQSIDVGQPMAACEAIESELASSSSPQDRAELLDDLIGALQAAGELRTLSRVVEERQALSAHVGDGCARITALAFDHLQAELLSVGTPAKHCVSLLALLGSSDLDTERRLRVVRLLMMAADELIDENLAVRAHRAGTTIQTSEPNCALLQKHIGLIFHSVFGDPEAALRIVDEISDLVGSSHPTWLTFVSRQNCSLARQLVGQQTFDHSQLKSDYQACLDAGMKTNAAQCAARLASVHIDDGDLEGARHWLAMADALIVGSTLGFPYVEYLSAQVDLALLLGDEARARHFLAEMHESARKYECGRLRNDLLLYRLRVEQVCRSATVGESDLAELMRFHKLGRRFGRHDDHMDVLWVALNSAGRGAEAHALLREYLTKFRRERRSCRYFLRHRTQSDPAWGYRALAR